MQKSREWGINVLISNGLSEPIRRAGRFLMVELMAPLLEASKLADGFPKHRPRPHVNGSPDGVSWGFTIR